jgi:hypothetical protein
VCDTFVGIPDFRRLWAQSDSQIGDVVPDGPDEPTELERRRAELYTEHERFRDLVGQVTEVNEAICAARPVVPAGAGEASPSGPGGGKGGSGQPSRRRRGPS